MKNQYETDPIAAARDALHQLSPDQLEYMLYDVRADHQDAVYYKTADEPQKLQILQMYEDRARKLGVVTA